MVDIEWRLMGDELEYSWSESGGPAVNQPTRKGFGSRILNRYATITLSGTPSASYDASGFAYRLVVPVRALQND